MTVGSDLHEQQGGACLGLLKAGYRKHTGDEELQIRA